MADSKTSIEEARCGSPERRDFGGSPERVVPAATSLHSHGIIFILNIMMTKEIKTDIAVATLF